MPLISRLSRLFQADLHAVLDRIEEPDAVLRQAVREMEEALERDTRQFKLMQREQARLCSRQSDTERSLSSHEKELEVCFKSNQDDLARKLIKRKLEAQRFASFLARQLQALESDLEQAAARLEENQGHLESMRQKADLLAVDNLPDHCDERWSAADFPVQAADVEVEFLRQKQQRGRS